MYVPKANSVTKSEAAYESIRSAILQGQLTQGQKITLKQLTDMLGMSHTPVREALRQLESHGLLVHEPNRGTFVASYSREKAERIYRLRKTLEPMATELAANNARPEDMERLEKLLDELDRASSPREISLCNEQWHRSIYALSEDPLLLDFIEKLWSGVPFQTISLSDNQTRVEQSRIEHHGILDALARGDAAEAARRMQVHIANGERSMLDSF